MEALAQDTSVEKDLVERQLIPWDKSWLIRLGFLDIINYEPQIAEFLDSQEELGEDLWDLRVMDATWHDRKPAGPIESGTLFRDTKYAIWKFGLDKAIVKKGTLVARKICDDPDIINWSQSELLKLDHGTSQWASAATLLGDTERLDNPPYKLALTYEAVDHWNEQRAAGQPWHPRRDPTILRQAAYHINSLQGYPIGFAPQHAEDACFAIAHLEMSLDEAVSLWPSIAGHESDRIYDMNRSYDELAHEVTISSRDHRVVQAFAMLGQRLSRKIHFTNPEAVNKSWPEFWNFLQHAESYRQ